MKSFLKGFFITILLVIIVAVGGFYFLSELEDNPEDRMSMSEFFTGKDKFQVLLIGVDSLDQKNAGNTRSDVIMLLNVDRERDEISLISIPRDTRAYLPDRDSTEKINHAYAYDGPEGSLHAVNALLGTEVEDYMVIDYAFVKDVVDIVGGVEVDVPMDMVYEDPTADPPLYIDLKAGRQVLNGDEALQFLRFRKGYQNQDLDRVKAQQSFLTSLFSTMKDKKNIIHGPQLLISCANHTNSTLSVTEVSKLGLNVLRIGGEDMKTYTLPGVPRMINGLSYFVLDESQTKFLLTDLGIK